jgi:ribosomal protein S18 acetylase RimI-like enzyme
MWVVDEGPRGAKTYDVTDDGRAELRSWLLPDPDRRRRRLPCMLRAALTALTAHDGPGACQLAALGSRIVGAAIWDPPGHRGRGPWRRARVRATRLRALGPSGLRRMAVLGERLGAVRPAEPHWYLDHLGADPGVPRCGAGSALLSAGLARADADGVASYLECKAGNVAYYRRFGFEQRDEVALDRGRLVVLTMLRPPP